MESRGRMFALVLLLLAGAALPGAGFEVAPLAGPPVSAGDWNRPPTELPPGKFVTVAPVRDRLDRQLRRALVYADSYRGSRQSQLRILPFAGNGNLFQDLAGNYWHTKR